MHEKRGHEEPWGDDRGKNPIRSPDDQIDPVKLARRDLKKALPRRFFTEVTVVPVAGGFGVALDGKPVLTPAKAPLAVATSALAEAMAAEWRAQTEWIEPDSMPLTRLANTAIDGVAKAMDGTVDEVAKFAETDLVCYRAGEPDGLVAAQSAAWDPILAFARRDLDAFFMCTQGVTFVAQPDAARAAVRSAVQAIAAGPFGAHRLAGLSTMTSLTGSILLSLAVARGVVTPEDAWTAAHVDEDYQMGKWGQDAEALARRRRRWIEMRAAADVLGA